MSAAVRIAIVSALFGAFCSGCLGPRRDDYISSRPITMIDGSGQTDRLWEAVKDTLRDGRFRLDRVDRRAGVVTTMPVMSQHFFEVWRHDVDTREDLWESTINPIRRRVEIEVKREDGGDWRELAVVVRKERKSSPDRQFNSTGAVYQYFGDRLPSTTGQVRVTEGEDRWIDLGRDPAMEDRLLRAILKRAGIDSASNSFQ